MTFKTVSAAAALGLALSGTGYAGGNQPQIANNQAANSVAYYQFERKRNTGGDNQGANSVAYQPAVQPTGNQAANSVVACK